MNNKAGAVGIDLGGQNVVIAVSTKGGVEIITNEASQRETPNVVGFKDQERLLGELGFVQVICLVYEANLNLDEIKF